jgi:hypothetical protein
MANATIIIGTGQSEYTFTVPPEFRPQIETIRNTREERIGERHTWPVRGYLAEATTENISNLWDELVERLRTEDVICKFEKDSQTLQELNPTDCARGPHFSGPRIITAKDGAWSTNLEFAFDIVAEIYDTVSGIISNEYEIEYREHPDGKLERVKTGRIRTEPGTSAKTAAESASPAVPAGYALDSESITPNEEDTEAAYTFILRKLFSPLPRNVRIAERIATENLDRNRRTITYKAQFTGPGASDAAEEYLAQAPGQIVEKSVATHTDSEAVEIEYTVVMPGTDGRRVELSESITLTGGIPEVRAFPVDGREPVFFKGAVRPYEVIQSGSEVWLDCEPPLRPTLNSTELVLADSKTEIIPGPNASGGQPATYTRTWQYRYLAKTQPQVAPVKD